MILTIAGKDIPIVYNLRAMYEMERSIGRMSKVNEDLKGAERVSTLIKLIAVMAKAAGGQVDEEWLWDNIKPADFLTVYIVVMNAYTEGMKMEVDPNDGKPVDVGLMEIKKKKARGSRTEQSSPSPSQPE